MRLGCARNVCTVIYDSFSRANCSEDVVASWRDPHLFFYDLGFDLVTACGSARGWWWLIGGRNRFRARILLLLLL